MSYIPRYHAKLRKVTYTKRKSNHTGLWMFITTVLLSACFYFYGKVSVYEKYEKKELVSPRPIVVVTPTAKPTPIEVVAEPKNNPSVEEIIKKEFGKDATVMIAIAKAESGLNPNTENFGKASGRYKGECSVGLFQINLRSNGCVGARVHWSKVPGKTLEEKIAWLKVPENNVKVAKQIYLTQGITAWSAYTNGSYKQHLTLIR